MAQLEEVIWRDAETSTSTTNIIGTVKELFGDCEFLPVTKNLDKRVTLMFKKDNKIATVVCSDTVSKLQRAGKLSFDQILSFPIIKGDKGLFAVLPFQEWIEMKSIVVREYKPAPLTLEELKAL